MKFSIITPSYSQGPYIRQNIESVIAQNWPDVEHIIIDGGSQDETIEIIRGYPHLIWVSEKDEGQADALNKGLRMATGDIVGWINSDDYYLNGALKKVGEVFNDPAVQWVIGDISLFFEDSGEFITQNSPSITWDSLQRNPDCVRQQGVFIRRDFLLQAGGWNKQFYMVMDFDLWVRLAKRTSPIMLNEQLGVFRIQKNQKTGIANIHRQLKEIMLVLRREGADPIYIWRFRVKKEWQWVKGSIKLLLARIGLLDRKCLLRPLRGR